MTRGELEPPGARTGARRFNSGRDGRRGSRAFQRGEAELELIDPVAEEGDLRLEPDLALGSALDAG